jgi:hypothetical protein
MKYCRLQNCSREDLHLDPSPSHGDMHGSYTSGAVLRTAVKKYVMPVLPRPERFGRPPCALLHQ